MDISFIKGCMLSGTILWVWKVYSEFKYISLLNENKLDELERRIESLEDFRLRFYQLYTAKDQRAWTLDSDEEDSDDYEDEDEDEEEEED